MNGFIRLPKSNLASIPEHLLTATAEAKSYSVVRTLYDNALLPRYLLDSTYTPPKNTRPAYSTGIVLKSYQEEPVRTAVSTLTQSGGALLQAPCGSGKTIMALSIAAGLGLENVVILVDQVNIAVQWRDNIQAVLGKQAKIYCADHESLSDASIRLPGFKVIVAQSLMRHDWLSNPLQCDMLIVDEAHVFSAPAFLSSIFNLDFIYSLALTATPDRKDRLEWVFLAVLGRAVITVDRPPSDTVVNMIRVHLPNKINERDYYMWWCPKMKKVTWLDACRGCELIDKYPNCGGFYGKYLGQGRPRILMSGLIRRVVLDPAYVAFTEDILKELHANKRHVFVFSHLKEHLRFLYKRAIALFGEESCGLYIGGALAEDKQRREVAMSKQLTFCTYSIANKALDMPHKDTAFFTSPVSDVRQAKGRIERTLPNKKRPVIIDPIITGVGLFLAMAKKREKTYKETASTVTYVNRDYTGNKDRKQQLPDTTKKGN